MDDKRLRELAGLDETFKDPLAVRSIEKTLKQMEKFIGEVGRDQERGDFEGETFFDGYDSALTIWLRLLAKEFPGLRKNIR